MENQQTNPGINPVAVMATRPLRDRKGNVYRPAIGPRLKILLALIFASVAVLGATGAYLVAIRGLNWWRAPADYSNAFTIWMFFVHVAVGLVIALPFLAFGLTHYYTARHRKNRPAVRLGIALFITGIIVVFTGLALSQDLIPGMPKLPTDSLLRSVTFWLHVLVPVASVVLYVMHRRAGPDIKWSWGIGWGAAVGGFVIFMLVMHSLDPRKWGAVGPAKGAKVYYFPSEVHTVDGNFIPAKALMMDKYCLKCHQDIYDDHFHSAHKFSSFNNPAYLFSVRKTREVGLKRDGHVRASRWCAGCHDPVPFFSGAFDDPNFDDVKHPTAHAGITCTVCHAITHVNSSMGNAAYTIEEPLHYPFAYSDNAFLQWINNRLVKAKPDFHKKTFLKPFHKTAEFCSTCHKVSLPMALNHYKEFTRGQNHYDPFLLSGVSGTGARSFYYPPRAKKNCAECHMPPKESQDFGSKDFDGSGKRKVHGHHFIGANTGLFYLLSREFNPKADPARLRRAQKAHADFLRDDKVRIDLFGLKAGDTPEEDGSIQGKLIAPLRPKLPVLQPGRTYLVEVVIRTVNLGHVFPQGTADSNEIWVDFQALAGKRVIGRNGALSDEKHDRGEVDPWAHFVNVYLLGRARDRRGRIPKDPEIVRIDRRNPEDIVIPLYDHQIPPGAGQVVHYQLKVPEGTREPVTLKVRLRYRKFDHRYLSHVYGKGSKIPRGRGTSAKHPIPTLPIVDMCSDQVTLPVAGMQGAAKVMRRLQKQKSAIPAKIAWQRWNDYGIGCFLEGAPGGTKVEGAKQTGELEQAAQAFRHLAYSAEYRQHPVARGNGLINLARTYNDMGLLARAVKVLRQVNALNRRHKDNPPVPWWTIAWVGGQVNARNKNFDAAIDLFEKILDPDNQPRERAFDFTRDYVVINSLGKALFERAQDARLKPSERARFLRRAVGRYEGTLRIDTENVDAHLGLMRSYRLLAGTGIGVRVGKSSPATESNLLALAQVFADAETDRAERLRAAARLDLAVREFGDLPTKPTQPKVPVLARLRNSCRAVYLKEEDAGLRAAAAQVLGSVHAALFQIYQPDFDAPAIIGKFRKDPKNRAASKAANPVVLYPTDRVRP
jgi:tetratricopeptide (TPR) repeat protein